MTDWHLLQHAYGQADDVPELLARLSPDPKAEVWEELWSRLCHQETIYTASLPALSPLLDAARRWPAIERGPALDLAAAIVAFRDSLDDADEEMASLSDAISELGQLGQETLTVPGLSTERFVATQQAILTFRGEDLWGRQLDRILSGEFEGICPSCDTDLLLVVGSYGFFVTDEDWVNRPSTPRTPITPASPDKLSGTGLWLYNTAITHNQAELASWYLYLFGTSICPQCGKRFELSRAVHAALLTGSE